MLYGIDVIQQRSIMQSALEILLGIRHNLWFVLKKPLLEKVFKNLRSSAFLHSAFPVRRELSYGAVAGGNGRFWLLAVEHTATCPPEKIMQSF